MAAYYKQLDGKSYDKEMLDIAEQVEAGRKDRKISIEGAKKLLDAVKDADRYTEVEKSTMRYIRDRYRFTETADKWFRKEIRVWAAQRGVKAKTTEIKSAKATTSTKRRIEEKENKNISSRTSPQTSPQKVTKHPHVKLIEQFYSSFQRLDTENMIACYHREVTFSDPGFPDLKGREVGAMWKMLCAAAQGFDLTFSGVEADDKTGKAHWETSYDLPILKTRIHNKVDAKFKFKDGKIIHHTDSFDLSEWMKMALGPVGFFLGSSSLLQGILKKAVNMQLQAYLMLRLDRL